MNPAIFVNLAAGPVEFNGQADVPIAREIIRYDDFVRKLLKPDSEQLTALHIGIGLAGELCEFVKPLEELVQSSSQSVSDNLIEELGDIEFYLQAAHNFYGTTVDDTFSYTREPQLMVLASAVVELVTSVGNLADLIKREYIYGKPRELKSILMSLGGIHDYLNSIYMLIATSREHILQCNAIKLQTRYTSLVYASEAAIARADKPKGE